MKNTFTIFLTAILFLIFVQAVEACSILVEPLRKQFRRADAVFVGKVSKVIEYAPTEKEILGVPENWRDWKIWSKVDFEVEKKWKGNLAKTQQFISVAYYICGCSSTMSQLKEGEKYLVFSEGKNFVSVCNTEENESDTAKKKKRNKAD